jgi:hypothetical protein
VTANVKEPQNSNKLVVAATFEMAKNLAFCRTCDLGPIAFDVDDLTGADHAGVIRFSMNRWGTIPRQKS